MVDWEIVEEDEDDFEDEEAYASLIEKSCSSSENLVFVIFSAPWCKKCKVLKSKLKEGVATQCSVSKVVEIDAGEYEDLAMAVGVKALPYFEVYDNSGKKSLSGSGLDDFDKFVSDYSGKGDAEKQEKPTPVVAKAPPPAAPSTVVVRTAVDLDENTPCLNVPYFPGGFKCDGLKSGTKEDANAISKAMQRTILGLYSEFISEDGNEVDYKSMLQSKVFLEDYLGQAMKLRDVDLGALSSNERKVFCLNVYNALTMHGTMVFGAPKLGALGKFFGNVAYEIGGERFSLDDIEHGILRANSEHGGKLLFPEGDARARLVVEKDPRIHFALVCGAKSCPPIRIFKVENAERGLDMAAHMFVKEEVTVDVAAKSVLLSKLFFWYGKDFGSTLEEQIMWIAKKMESGSGDTSLLDLLKKEGIENLTVNYKDYDWSSNAKE